MGYCVVTVRAKLSCYANSWWQQSMSVGLHFMDTNKFVLNLLLKH